MADEEPLLEKVCTYDPLIELMARFENVRGTDSAANPFEGLTIEQALQKHIVEGIKKGLEGRLEEALAAYEPLQIINEILLAGMKTVGELFGAGKMQLPFVLQSAETMKAAVRYLEPKMEKVEGSEKGSILLATVAGDVHDIGKNLVDIILSNNGYRVANIGIKQPINAILDKAAEHDVQVIGLSGLLVKSTLVMKDNLVEMNERGLSRYPVILGGAALTRGYVEEDLRSIYEGQVFYARDAFEGLRLMEELSGTGISETGGAGILPAGAEGILPSEGGSGTLESGAGILPAGAEGILPSDDGAKTSKTLEGTSSQNLGVSQSGSEKLPPPAGKMPAPPSEEEGYTPRVRSHRTDVLDPRLYAFTGERSEIVPVAEPPKLPFYGARKHTKFDIFEIYKYINPIALFRGQWQYRRQEGMDNPAFTEWLEENVRPIFERMQRELASVLKPRVKWGYFPCASEGNDLIIFEEDARTERLRFTFPRQSDGKRLCLADFFLPSSGEARDTVGFSIVTVGAEVSEHERKLFKGGAFEDYLYVHGMGVESAEALAEYWHRQMRIEMGIADQEPSDMRLLFSAKYHGARYSFGYPACPNLEDQAKLMELLQPQDIGIELSEEFMLIPEQTTSAIVVHHPEAKYFNIR